MRELGNILTLGPRKRALGSRSWIPVQDDDRDSRQKPGRVSIDDLVEYVAEHISLDASVVQGGGGGGTNTIVVAGQYTCDVVTCSGTDATLSETPLDPSEAICLLEASNLVLRWKASAPGANEFTISGTTISVNAARANAVLKVYYRMAGGSPYFAEFLTRGTYPGYTATLSYTPTPPEKTILIWEPANLALRYTTGTPGPNEFSVTGAVVATGRELTADGQALAHYPLA